jgi:hypothetical protein
MSDLLKLLAPFEWRGRKYPVIARSVSFSHDGARHKYQYRDDEAIEQLGAQSLTFSYTLAMREDIFKGKAGYEHLFTVGYPTLFRDMRDRTRGPLVDLALGTFICVPTSFSDDMDPQKRDGTDVRVEFVHSPDPDAQFVEESPPTIQGLKSDAAAMDAELAKVDWEQEESPEPTVDPLSAISGVGAQAEAQFGKTTAALEDVAFRCAKVEQQIDRAENPDLWPLQRALRANRYNAIKASKRAKDPTKKVVQIAHGESRPLSVVAAEFGMTIEQLIQLNPSFAGRPFVPAGTPISIFKKP